MIFSFRCRLKKGFDCVFHGPERGSSEVVPHSLGSAVQIGGDGVMAFTIPSKRNACSTNPVFPYFLDKVERIVGHMVQDLMTQDNDFGAFGEAGLIEFITELASDDGADLQDILIHSKSPDEISDSNQTLVYHSRTKLVILK
jgi:hypothetical protein